MRLPASLLLLAAFGCSTPPAPSDSGIGAGGGAGGGGLTDDGGTSEVIAAPHQPDGGCRANFADCATVCADLTTDSRHCSACGNSCASPDGGGFGYGCEGSSCVVAAACANGRITCDAGCRDPLIDVDHCGSCFNRCSDRQLCQAGACTSVQGTGASCTSPVLLPAKGLFTFRFPSTLTSAHLFPCGPLTAVQSRWLRFTSTKTGSITVEVRESADDYVLEVFSGAACDAATSLACNDDQAVSSRLPFVTFSATSGQTYFIAVGQVSGAPGALPVLKVND